MKLAISSHMRLWRLVKWAKTKSELFREISKLSTLHTANDFAETFEKKTKILKNVFFSSSSLADLSDIIDFRYSTVKNCSMLITKSKITQAICRSKVDKTSSSDEISNRILKTCSKSLTETLTSLFQTCITQTYHSRVFRAAHTITLKKLDKDDYITTKIYRLIALLNTLNKMLKFIIVTKICYLIEHHRLLSKSQMSARRDKFTETALKLFIEQMHTMWDQRFDKIATLLSMNVADVFFTISHSRLIHNLRKRKISLWITSWTKSFLQKRIITLTIQERSIDFFEIRIEIF